MYSPNRPGSGASTNVPLEKRLAIWLELVPCLLAHRGIEHVALVSHSAGTIYLLNTLYHCRSILHPDRPFVALLGMSPCHIIHSIHCIGGQNIVANKPPAPWVDPSHSRVTSMQMARYVPAPAFSLWNRIPQLFLLKAGPAFASSGTVVTKLSNVVFSGGAASGGGQDSSEVEVNRRRIEEEYGLARDVQAELDSLMFKFMFAEDTVAANDEALQCLKKGGTWGRADDYGEFVRELVELERRRVGDAECIGGTARLKVRAYFAESDAMIGKRGQKYVEECWRGKEDGEWQDVLDFQSTTVAGTDHDSLVQSVKALEMVFVDAGGSMENDAVGSR